MSGTESPGALEDERMSQDNGEKDLKMQKKKGGGGRKEAKEEWHHRGLGSPVSY